MEFFKQYVLLAVLVVIQLSAGIGTAAAASTACAALNGLSGDQLSSRVTYTPDKFEAGDTFSISFSNNGSQAGLGQMGSDYVLAHAQDQTVFWTYYASDKPAGLVSKSYDSAFLTTHGLWLQLNTGNAITGVSVSCVNTTATVNLTVTPTAFPDATYGQAYSQTLTASGGTEPYSFTVTSGTLPPGISLSASGVISGTPTEVGAKPFTVRVSDSAATPNAKDISTSFNVVGTYPSAPPAPVATAGDGQAIVAFVPPSSDGGYEIASYTVTASPGNIKGYGSNSPIMVNGLTNGTAYTFTVAAYGPRGSGPDSPASNSVMPVGAQTITFLNPGSQNFGNSPTLTATSSSGLPVTFASTAIGVCTTTPGGALTFLSAGICSITATQVGNASYAAAAPVQQSFQINAVAPGAPVMGTATVGDGLAIVSFSAPASNGGGTITGYTVTSNPGGITATSTGSPVTVTGLTNGVAYTFTATATNAAGTSAASAASNSVISKGSQTISFPNPGAKDFGSTSQLDATASSGLSVLLTSNTTSVCTISGTSLHAVAPGNCSVTANQPGNAAYGAAATVTQSFAIVVPGGAVSISTTSVPNAVAGKAYAAALSAAGGAAPFTWSLLDGAPAGIALSTSGALAGTASTSGSYGLKVRITDAAGQIDEASVQLVIDAPAIVIAPSAIPAGRVGEVYDQTLTASGGTAPYQFTTTGTLPAGMRLSMTGQLRGTPLEPGTFAVQVTATDALGFDVGQTYTLIVAEKAPITNADTATTSANAAVSIPVTRNDAGPITGVAIVQAPVHGTATVDGLAIAYTPGKDYFGTDTLTYTAIGPGGASQAATVSITVNAGALPIAAAKTITLQAGTSVTIDAAEGATNGPFVAAAVTTKPATGAAQVRGTSLIYMAAADGSGKVTFDYTLSNAFGASAPATVTLQVNPVPVAPSIVEVTVAGNTSTVDLTAGATGGPFTAAAVVSVQPATAGTATIAQIAGGYALTFTANELFSGAAKVAYTLSNAFATSAASVVSFTVQGRSDPSKDAEVIGILSAQADATRRMATGQISNFQRRLEQLHNGHPATGFSNGITLNSASASAATARDDRARGHGPNTTDDRSAVGSSILADQKAPASADQTAGLLPGGASVWTGGAVNFGKAGSTRGNTSTDFTTSGLSMGADKLFSDGLIIGAGVGYGHDNTDVGSQQSSSKVDSYSAAIYASYRPTDAFFIDSLLGYQWLSLDSVRTVTDNGGRVIGSRSGKQWFGSLSTGYLLQSKDIQLTPYGRFDVAQASLDSFSEQGDDFYALNYQAQVVKTSTVSTGVLAQFTVKRDYGVWAPQLRAEYGRDLEGASNALMSYADLLGGHVYRANLLQQSRDHTLLGGGLSLQTLGGWTVSAEYQVQLESNTGDNQSVRIGIEKKFDH